MDDSQVAAPGRNAKMAEMVQLITQRGPKIDEISRAIGVHSETVRYWYRQLLEKGFSIQASCNYESLGMKRVVSIVELGDDYKRMSDMIFFVMNQFAYVIGYAETRPGGTHVLSSSVPEECMSEWVDLMLELKKAGFLKSMESVTLDWVRNVPMRAECFDFESGRWAPVTRRGPAAGPGEVQGRKQKYDRTDLKIIGQLQVDANMSLTEMCDKVGARNYKTFTWHYREHVFRRRMIKGYRVNWTGMRRRAKKQGGKSRYSWMDIIASGLSEDDKAGLGTRLNESPFVWIEGGGSRSYYARMVFPVEYGGELRALLDRAVAGVGGTVRRLQMDESRAFHFSLETLNYDEDNQRWNLNKEQVLQTFESLDRIREATQSGLDFPSRA